LRRLEHVTPLPRRHAGVIHQQIQAGEFVPREFDERVPITLRGNITLEDGNARLGLQTFSRVPAALIRRNDVVCAGQFTSDGAPDAAACASDDRAGACHQWPASASSSAWETSSKEKRSMKGLPFTNTVGVWTTPRATPS